MIGASRSNSGSAETSGRFTAQRTDLLFALLLAVACLANAWFTFRGTNGDSIAYFDLSEAVREHHWHAIFNASWFPLYPACLTLARAFFHFNPRFDGAASHLLNGLVGILLLASAAAAAAGLHELVNGSAPAPDRLSRRTICAASATVAYLIWSIDVAGTKPDALMSAFVLFAVACLAFGLSSSRLSLFLLAGSFAGAAYWTKAFALPLVCLLLLFTALVRPRSRSNLAGLSAMALVFFLIAGPYIGAISAAKHRFTIGDAGRLNTAWFVNGAERFNPVNDPAMDALRQASGHFLHPPELLASMPEVTWYGNSRVFGHMPAWDDFSFWSDGLSPRLVPGQYAHQISQTLVGLALLAAMRAQLLVLILAPLAFGFAPRRLRGYAGRALVAITAAAVASIGLYALVHFEPRYILFAIVLVAAAFLLSLARQRTAASARHAHAAVLLLATVICITDLEEVIHGARVADAQTGDQPLHALFDMPDYTAGTALRHFVPVGSQVGCLGLGACFGDALWSWYAGDRVAAVLTLPHSMESASPEQVCTELSNHPEALQAMQARGIRAVVGWFSQAPPCGTGWQPLAGTSGYYLLPLR
jgi:hypothetical protein